jgi:hypothetical protein
MEINVTVLFNNRNNMADSIRYSLYSQQSLQVILNNSSFETFTLILAY